jgi:hypothetical protein
MNQNEFSKLGLISQIDNPINSIPVINKKTQCNIEGSNKKNQFKKFIKIKK